MALRDEWFGKHKISDLLRSNIGIGSTQEMAKAVQPKTYPLDTSPDEVLKSLIEKEYQRYQQLTGDDLHFFNQVLRVLRDWPGTFPITEKIIYSFERDVKNSPYIAADKLAEIAFLFEQSQSQSRKTRAGSSLELQLEYVLKNNGINKWEKQKKLVRTDGKKKTKVDFVFPSVEHFELDPLDCIAFCCQTTSNDRFRSALGQVNLAMKFIPTGIGSINFGSNLKSLTKSKLDEVHESGAKYVMFPEGKNFNQLMATHPAIITYEVLIEKMKKRHDSWS